MILWTLALVTNLAAAQELKKGAFQLDVFYGGPNLVTRLLDSDLTLSGSSTKVSGFGPIGIRGEYMISDMVSFGLEVHHATSKVRYTWNGSNPYEDQWTINRTRIYPRFAVHFGKDNLDIFWHLGVGYALWNSKYEVIRNSDPDNNFRSAEFKAPNGFAVRTGIGARYYFTQSFGVNMDVGLGGPLVTFGVSGKF